MLGLRLGCDFGLRELLVEEGGFCRSGGGEMSIRADPGLRGFGWCFGGSMEVRRCEVIWLLVKVVTDDVG